MKYFNPIIPGFNPDPSICRVGDDFYIATSTFEFFPGVPIYHSKNLVNWEHIGYCLTRKPQLPLQGCGASKGIYAPTIRYHDGVFFMIAANVSGGGTFIVHTPDIHGEWSEPVWLNMYGFDPSLFWDDDGTCYMVAVHWIDDEAGHYLYKIDPFTGKILSEAFLLTHGCGGKATEAPHIYKIHGKYYLLLSEGGTEYGHMVKILRSNSIYGPYEECPRNPILTHRESGGDGSDSIQGVGHADIVEDQNGNWWAVCLGFRPISAFYHNLGRETFLAPLVWDSEGWPIIGNNGRLNTIMEGSLPGKVENPVSADNFSFFDDFNGDKLDLRWNFLRNPLAENYELKNSKLTLRGSDITLSTPCGNPTMLAVRQQAFENSVTATMSGDVALGQSSGITVFYNDSAHYDILVSKEEDGFYVNLRRQIFDINVITDRRKIDYSGSIRLRIETATDFHSFYYEVDGEWILLGRGMTAGLCKEAIFPLSFTGCYLGMFSEKGEIDFDSFAVTVKDEFSTQD